MKKLIVLSFFLLAIVAAPAVFAEETTDSATSATTEITQDLGVENPGILPTSPFYFLKSWSRGIKRAFTVNPVKKAELELDITSEQAAEIKEIKNISPDKTIALDKAIQNYQANVERLRARLEELKETSQNPNVDKLLEKLTDRSVKHQQLFDELKNKIGDKPELKEKIEILQDKMGGVTAKIPEKFEGMGAFKERLQRVIENQSGNGLKELKATAIIDRINAKFPEARQAELKNLEEILLKKFETRTATSTEQIGITKERIEKITTEAKNLIAKAKTAISSISSVALKEMATKQIEAVKTRITNSEKALAEGKMGEAFGQATVAVNQARNILRRITQPMATSTPEIVVPQQ